MSTAGHSRKTSPPTKNEDLSYLQEGMRMPSDFVAETISALRQGSVDIIDDLYEDVIKAPESISHNQTEKASLPAAPNSARGKEHLEVPSVIASVLASPAKEELIAIAKFIDPGSKRKLKIVFHTPIGPVRAVIDGNSNKPEDILRRDRILLLKIRKSDFDFQPIPGTEFDVSLQDYAGRVRVICLSPPQPLYPGVDLLCLLPHNLLMEKNGRLNESAPSIVSGLPGDSVDELGEPLKNGEKSASSQAQQKLENKAFEDFDKPRT